MKRIAALSPLLVVVLACGSATPTPVPLEASAAEPLAPLAGTWVGEYQSDANGRQGSIVFELRADERAATGDVVMFSSVVSDPAIPRGMAASSHVLKISFVRVAGDEVSGKIDPYPDPASGATLSTTFAGRLTGNTIEGTFETAGAGSGVAPQRGRWTVTRR